MIECINHEENNKTGMGMVWGERGKMPSGFIRKVSYRQLS